MAKQNETELLRSIWTIFDVSWADIRKHQVIAPVFVELVGDECSQAQELSTLLDCIDAKGRSKEALNITLRSLHENWPQLLIETRAKILELGKFYPQQIKAFPPLSPRELALGSVRWDVSDILFGEEQSERFLQIAAQGLDLKAGSFIPADRINLDIWKTLPELLAPLLTARIEYDLVAISYAAPNYRRECEERVRKRAGTTRNSWHHSVQKAFHGLDAFPLLSDLLKKLENKLDPIISRVSEIVLSASRQAKFQQMAFPPLPPSLPPPDRTIGEKIKYRLERNWVTVVAISVVTVAVPLLAVLKDVHGVFEWVKPKASSTQRVSMISCVTAGDAIPDTDDKDSYAISFSSCTSGQLIESNPHWAVQIKEGGDYEVLGEIGWASAPTAYCELYIVRQTGSENPTDVDAKRYNSDAIPSRIVVGPTKVSLKKGDRIWLAVGQHSNNQATAILGDDTRNKFNIDLLVSSKTR